MTEVDEKIKSIFLKSYKRRLTDGEIESVKRFFRDTISEIFLEKEETHYGYGRRQKRKV